MTQRIIDVIANACILTSTPEQIAEYYKNKLCIDKDYLTDWYLHSNENENPNWTYKHIEELFDDFYLIPKR